MPANLFFVAWVSCLSVSRSLSPCVCVCVCVCVSHSPFLSLYLSMQCLLPYFVVECKLLLQNWETLLQQLQYFRAMLSDSYREHVHNYKGLGENFELSTVPDLSSGLWRAAHSKLLVGVSLFLKARQIQVVIDGVMWNLQKRRIPECTPYIRGLELAFNF